MESTQTPLFKAFCFNFQISDELEKRELDLLEVNVQQFDELPQNKQYLAEERHFLFFVDKSGSMSGQMMTDTKTVTSMMIQHIRSQFARPLITLFSFDTEVHAYGELEKLSAAEVEALVGQI